MLPQSPPLLAGPPIDQPAAADPMTPSLLRRARRTTLLTTLFQVVVLVSLSAELVFLSGSFRIVLALLAGRIAYSLATRPRRRLRWFAAISALAAVQPWRPAAVRLVRGGPKARYCVVEADDGRGPQLFRVSGLLWAGQLAVAMSGTLWLLGPGDSGQGAVRLPGLGLLSLTREATEPQGEVPVIPAPGTTGTALDDPVTDVLLDRSQTMLRSALLLAAAVAVFAVLSWFVSPPVGVGFAVALLFLLVNLWRQRTVPALAAAARRGPWIAVPLWLDRVPRTTRPVVRLTGEIQLADGRAARIDVPRASTALADAARVNDRLWFAGHPVPGTRCLVGVPGTCLLGLATIRER